MIDDLIKTDYKVNSEYHALIKCFMIDSDYNKHYSKLPTKRLYELAENYAKNIIEIKYIKKKGDI